MVKITINKATPSPNQWIRKHWSTYHKIKKEWNKLVSDACLEQKVKFHQNITPASVSIHRQGRSLDWDNLYGSVKPLIDALRASGLIVDDDQKNMPELKVTQEKGKPQTVIKIRKLSVLPK